MGVKPKTVLPIVEPKSEKSPEEKAEEEHLARQEAERVEEEQKKRREAEIERERVVEEIKQKWLGENRRCAPGELNREVEERLKGGN